ncbi:MFS transporter, ACS family, glucarate transporter [Faunimonas pinastri]|uniref:MFS transporter, ACS family, glucarate transporter n=1 Tax=Faunimonas pinastri TaxID=1855383 RepID=A0A1H9ESL4_9HYPH|nr:MFS transporter [Faunimonas pinastri]SEQ28587.1 MFS transporter, ACS family, glucarate transporter [Faunimonas pinastri]
MVARRRFLVYAGIFIMMALCYVDRINLSVAAKSIATSYGLSPVQLGFIFSAFLWTYLICLVPLGMAVDRWGARSVTAGSLLIWSVAGVLTGMATTYTGLFASRLALGVGEAASYPAGGRVIREWAPQSERGIAAAILNSGAYAGLAIGAPVVGWLVAHFGWRESFYVTGALGVVLSVLWYAIYRRPEQAGWLSVGERTHILAGRGETAKRDAAGPDASGSGAGGPAIGALLRSPSMWGLALTQGCAGYTLYLFMTWLPTYLADTRGLDVMRSGAFSAVPYAAAVPLGLLLGVVSDRFLRRTGTAGGGRRRLVAVALLVSSVILLTPYVTNIWLILALFSISLTCVSTAMGMNIALTNDLLVNGAQAGAATSLLILGGNSFGIVAPIATGYIVASPLGYSGAFVVAGVLLLTGVATSLLLTRRPIGGEPVERRRLVARPVI